VSEWRRPPGRRYWRLALCQAGRGLPDFADVWWTERRAFDAPRRDADRCDHDQGGVEAAAHPFAAN